MDRDRIIAEIATRNGVLLERHDPILLVSTMLDMHEADQRERDERIAAALSEINRPPAVLTDKQVDDIGARLARGAVTWIGGMVQAANRRHYALMLAALLAAAIVGGVVTSLGFGLHRWLTPAPPALTCQDDRGGTVCFYWKVAPEPPGKSTSERK